MTDRTDEFFAGLARRRHEPLLAKVYGTIRFELTEGGVSQLWWLAIEDGTLRVGHEDRETDMVLRTDREFFNVLIGGSVTPLAAWLRNEVTVEGKFQLLVMLERLLPSRPGARHPRDAAAAVADR
jgi:putative sterol carrier protein